MKQYKWFDGLHIEDLVAYPAWQGPQICLVVKSTTTSIDIEIRRHEKTYPEDDNHGDYVDTISTSNYYGYYCDKNVTETRWYYYSLFVEGARVATFEVFTFGSTFIRDNLWSKYLPELPYKVLDNSTRKEILSPTSLASVIESIDTDPQEVLFDQTTEQQGQLRRYIKYLSIEIDRYADLVNVYPKLFRIDEAPIFMLDIISELLTMRFKHDFTPIYKRQLLRFAMPRIIRKGHNSIFLYFVKLLLQNINTYIEEYRNHAVNFNDIGNSNNSDLTTDHPGSFWFGKGMTNNVLNSFVQGSYTLDRSENRLYASFVTGIYSFFHVEPTDIDSDLLNTAKYYVEQNISWLIKWFICIVQKNINESYSIENAISNNILWSRALLWNGLDGQGYNDLRDFIIGEN